LGNKGFIRLERKNTVLREIVADVVRNHYICRKMRRRTAAANMKRKPISTAYPL